MSVHPFAFASLVVCDFTLQICFTPHFRTKLALPPSTCRQHPLCILFKSVPLTITLNRFEALQTPVIFRSFILSLTTKVSVLNHETKPRVRLGIGLRNLNVKLEGDLFKLFLSETLLQLLKRGRSRLIEDVVRKIRG